jgi:hypothetical protein
MPVRIAMMTKGPSKEWVTRKKKYQQPVNEQRGWLQEAWLRFQKFIWFILGTLFGSLIILFFNHSAHGS